LTRRGAAAAALAADLLLGEPPARLHPTVWMGRWIGAARSLRRARSPLLSLAEGAAGVALGALLAAAAARAAERGAGRLPRGLRAPALGAALKPALSLRALLAAGAEVERALARGDLPEARRLLAWHLVSRDTAELSEAEVAGAAIESLAENLGDGLVAPLLAFRAGGLPAAYAFRLVNTADAMLGYRTPELEWFGKAAARADDALNLLPARLSALLLALAAPAGGGDPRAALRAALHDAARTPSPNAGWPMAAMAGALGVRLTKRGAYALNPAGRDPGPADLRRARRVVAAAGILAAVLAELSVGPKRSQSGRGR
jgi:adenosylcobinamide-phosphate synthase